MSRIVTCLLLAPMAVVVVVFAVVAIGVGGLIEAGYYVALRVAWRCGYRRTLEAVNG